MGARRVVLEAQYRKVGDQLPFTLESALQYRRIKMVHDTGLLPTRDIMIQFPDGVDNRRQYNLSSEYVYPWLARFFPGEVPFPNRLRWLEAGWFCMGIPFLFLWIRLWRRNWWAAGVGAAFYAVALSSVMRSTGQELSRENFALPILILHYLLDALYPRCRGRWAAGLVQIGSAVVLALALACWDLIQYPVMLRMAWMAWRVLRGKTFWTDPGFRAWVWQLAALAALGLAHPYYQSHGWILSPAMLMGYATLISAWLFHRPPAVWRAWCRTGSRGLLVWILLFGVGAGVGYLTAFGDAYSHFGGLLWAKIRHLNVKPADPTLLTFDQRIMWVPALHSVTPELFRALFPCILYLTIPAVLFSILAFRKQPDAKFGELLFSFGITLFAFILFARFHVYLALYASALIGCWAGLAASSRGWSRWLAVGLIGAGWLGEAGHTLQKPERWGRVNVYYKELDELAGWLREHAAPDPVLANFGASAYIAAYGKCAIILHPKFEQDAIRQRVQEYGEQLFAGNEESFRQWANSLGARYYVYAHGEFARESPELQMRYFVNAMDPPDTVPARRFEAGDATLRYFTREWGNHKYTVYRILTGADEQMALRHARAARRHLEQGDLTAAQAAAEEALALDGKLLEAAEILGLVGRLREVGFEHQPVKE